MWISTKWIISSRLFIPSAQPKFSNNIRGGSTLRYQWQIYFIDRPTVTSTTTLHAFDNRLCLIYCSAKNLVRDLSVSFVYAIAWLINKKTHIIYIVCIVETYWGGDCSKIDRRDPSQRPNFETTDSRFRFTVFHIRKFDSTFACCVFFPPPIFEPRMTFSL